MKVALLGLGFMGTTHLKALRTIPGVEVAALCSIVEKELSGDLTGVQGNIGGPGELMDFTRIKKYREVTPAVTDPDIDAVDICLPTHLHAAVAIEALRAGKHVLVEKPMALDGPSADHMVVEAQKQSRILMTGQVLRFSPAYVALREAISGGQMGRVRSAVFRRRCGAPAWGAWLADPAMSGGGAFDLLIHDVDICLHLFGKPSALLATGLEERGSDIDCLHAQLFYPWGGVLITGGWHPGAYPFSMEYTVVLDDGTIEYSSAGSGPMLYGRNGAGRTLALASEDGYAAEIGYFVECCRACREPAICPPAESADAVKLMRLLLEARERNGERIECNI
jgi:predicted dehydrogenase